MACCLPDQIHCGLVCTCRSGLLAHASALSLGGSARMTTAPSTTPSQHAQHTPGLFTATGLASQPPLSASRLNHGALPSLLGTNALLDRSASGTSFSGSKMGRDPSTSSMSMQGARAGHEPSGSGCSFMSAEPQRDGVAYSSGSGARGAAAEAQALREVLVATQRELQRSQVSVLA